MHEPSEPGETTTSEPLLCTPTSEPPLRERLMMHELMMPMWNLARSHGGHVHVVPVVAAGRARVVHVHNGRRSAAATIAAAATAAAAAATGTAARRCCRHQSPACARSGLQ